MAYVINYVGAGGKTSSILEKADEYAAEGKKVIVTTTTHMLLPRIIPEGTDILTENLKDAEALWAEGKIVWYGHPMGANGCFTISSYPEWQELLEAADVILVEGDGSRRHPVKVPNLDKEPVIFPETDQIVIVFGLSGLGKPVGEVCHREKLILEILNTYGSYEEKLDESHKLTEEDFVLLIHYGYLKPLMQRFRYTAFEIRLNQATSEKLREQAKRIAASDLLTGVIVSITNYDREVRV